MYTVLSPPVFLAIGNQGEAGTNHVIFNVSPWQTDYPTGAGQIATIPGVSDGLYISYTRSGETAAYPEPPENLLIEDDALTWTPSATVMEVSGQGTLVIHCVEGGGEKRAAMMATLIAPSHPAVSEAPPPLYDYIKMWGSVDAVVYRIDNSLDPEISVTQDDTGTHFVFGIPVNALMRDIENTKQLAVLNPDGTVTQVLHTDLDTSVILRTDDFVYFGDLVTQTRTLADGSYLIITSNLLTMEQTISNITKGA